MTKDLDAVKRMTDQIDGWLSFAEAIVLYDLARNCQGKGVIVNIGAWKGKSTIWLGTGSQNGNNVKVYSIDPHKGSIEHQKKYGKINTYNEFMKNIRKAGISKLTIPLVMTSEEAAKNFKEPVELVFIDGAHEYDMVKMDLDLWFPKVVDDGFIVFHDTLRKAWPGPKKVVDEFVYKSHVFKDVSFLETLTIAKKTKRNSLRDRMKNRTVLLVKNVCGFAVDLPIPKKVVRLIKKIIEKIILKTYDP